MRRTRRNTSKSVWLPCTIVQSAIDDSSVTRRASSPTRWARGNQSRHVRRDAPALAPGHFRFRATFSRPGRHLLQVFVLDGDATVVIPFDVARARPTS